jgi:hypothetical protein
MTTLIEAAALMAGGSGGTMFSQAIGGWWRDRREAKRDDRSADTRQEEHRDSLTFQLLTAAREEMTTLRSELTSIRAEAAQLRPLLVVGAHLEEALDHLHALLHAEGELELRAAERRARAFLKRMRPSIGDLRNMKQASDSAQRLAGQPTEPEA